MNKKQNDLLAVYLNEFNFNYLLKGAKKYSCKNILEVLNLNKVKTFTKDIYQDVDLDPWVQSVSINTGKSSKKHKILKLGQPVKKKQFQIWDELSQNKISCSVWGTMNSKLRKNKFLNYYFPDPWNFRDNTYPKNLMGLYFLPNYYAKNYLKFNYFKFFYFSILFFSTVVNYANLKILIKDLFFSFKLIIKKGIKNFALFFLFDQIFLNILLKTTQKKKSNFSMIFLNSIAHYQHNNWNETEYEKYFFLYVDDIFKKILEIKKEFNSFILFNGFTQRKISTEFLLRPKDPKKFLSRFIKFKKLEQDMTNGGFIFFDDKEKRNFAFKILSKLTCLEKNIFYIQKFNSFSIYYKINLKSKKKLDNFDASFKKSYSKRYLVENIKLKKKTVKQIDISDYFIKNIKFIKSSGVHTPQGLLFHNNLQLLNKKNKIENHKIFKFLSKHFQIYA